MNYSIFILNKNSNKNLYIKINLIYLFYYNFYKALF